MMRQEPIGNQVGLRALQRVVTAMTAREPLGATLALVLDGVREALGAEGARLVVRLDGQIVVRGEGSLSGPMAAYDDVMLAAAVQNTSERLALAHGLGVSSAALPGCDGALWVRFEPPRTLDEHECVFLDLMAGHAALALTHALALRAARQEQPWMAAALARIPDGVAVVDRDLRLQIANPAMGAASSACRQAHGQQLDAQHAAEWGLVEGIPAAAEVTGEDGRVYAPLVSEISGGDGARQGWVIVLRDITPFKQLNASMADFVSTVTHDMRSPLTFIKGYVDMLGMVGELNEKQARFVEKTLGGVVQMADMVEKILQAGKLDPITGTYQLECAPIDVAELAQTVVSRLADGAAKKNQTLTACIEPDLPPLVVDPYLLESAFTNLAENAVKYTPEGGRIEVALKREARGLVFSVADNGYGIAAEDQPKLFQRNVRIHRDEWKRVKGSGLGLFIVKKVAQRHGGDAWVESVEGQGSTFYLSLPLDDVMLPVDAP